MRRIPIFFIILILSLILAGALSCDNSQISADEAIAIVKQYEDVVWWMPSHSNGQGRGLDGEWDADYQGKGHWVVTSYTKNDDEYLNYHSWDYFENSGIINYRGVEHR